MAIKGKSQISTSRRSRRQHRSANNPVVSRRSSPPPPSLPDSELDIFFECGPFSVLCQGATDAEIAEDFKLLRAAIDEMASILLTSAISASSATAFNFQTLFEGVSENMDVPVSFCSIPASEASMRKSSRVKVYKGSAESVDSPKPLTPESFDEDPISKGSIASPIYDLKEGVDVIAPISFYGQLDVAEPARLRLKKRESGEDDNRVAPNRTKQLRPIFLR